MNETGSNFDIEKQEYEQFRHVFEMCKWINEKLTQIPNAIYLERKGKYIKELIEEAIPISRLGLHFFSPGSDVYVQCFAGNQPFDANLKVTGFNNLDIKVEATTIETEDSTLRRQAVSRNGFTYTSGSIQKKGRDIVSQPEFEDLTERDEEWTNCAFSRVKKKLEKPYGSDTAILVHIDTYRPISLECRARLIRRTHEHLRSISENVYGVYYSYTHGLTVDGIKRDDSI